MLTPRQRDAIRDMGADEIMGDECQLALISHKDFKNIQAFSDRVHIALVGQFTVEQLEAIIAWKRDMTPAPRLDSIWQHTNGQRYSVFAIANDRSIRAEYPPTIMYRNVDNGRVYSRPLSDWHRSMTEVPQGSSS